MGFPCHCPKLLGNRRVEALCILPPAPPSGKGAEDVLLEMVPEPGFSVCRLDPFHPKTGSTALRRDHRGLTVGREAFPENHVPPEGQSEQEPIAKCLDDSWNLGTVEWLWRGNTNDMRAPGQTVPGRAGDPWDTAISSLPNWTTTLGLKTRTQHPGRAVMGQCWPRTYTPHCTWTPTTVTGRDVHTHSLAITLTWRPFLGIKDTCSGLPT